MEEWQDHDKHRQKHRAQPGAKLTPAAYQTLVIYESMSIKRAFRFSLPPTGPSAGRDDDDTASEQEDWHANSDSEPSEPEGAEDSESGDTE